MPIKPENRARYPADWKAISHRIRFERAGGECECAGQCGDMHGGVRCCAPHGKWIYRNDSSWSLASFPPSRSGAIRVVLTTAHLDHLPENCADDNLLAMCQRCHLRYDRDEHARVRRETLRERRAVGELL